MAFIYFVTLSNAELGIESSAGFVALDKPGTLVDIFTLDIYSKSIVADSVQCFRTK